MLNKQEKENNKNLKEAMKQRIYNGYDIGEVEDFYILCNGIKYHVSPQYTCIIDQYDEAIGSIEQSHKEYDGYSIIDEYQKEESVEVTTLDFTFAGKEDCIDIELDDSITEVKLNSSNLDYSLLQNTKQLDIDIVIDNNIIESTVGLKRFIEKYKNIISSINVEGISCNGIYLKLIEKICASKEVYVITFEDKTTKNDLVKLKK